MKSSLRLASCILFAAAAHSVVAQSVVTEPVGFITIPAKGGSVATPATTFIALSMARPVVYQSLVPSASGQGATTVGSSTVITFPAASFTADQFGPTSGSFYLEITNGTNAGVCSPITATTTNSFTLRDNLTAGITNGTTTFRIRPNWTFGTAFGVTNQTGFQGAATSANADIIQLVDPVTATATGYFYNTGTTRWETLAGADATNVAISPEVGLQVLRKGTGDLNFKLAGAVKTGASGLYVTGSTANTYNLLANPYPLETVLLKDSGLYTGSDTTGVVGGTSASATSTTGADVVRIYDFTHDQYNDYYYDLGNANATPPISPSWKTGTSDASATVIPAGASIAIIRKANRGSFYWTAPQPAMVLGDTPLPLSLVSAASRKTQGAFGPADVNIPLTGSLGIESRNAASGNTHTLVFNFTNNVTSGSATVTTGIGTVSSVSFSGKTMTVNLTGVTDAQTVAVGLTNVTDSSSQVLASAGASLKFASGDVNGTSNANSLDVTIVKANASLGGALTLANFRADLNNDNTFNSLDVTIAKARASLGIAVP